MSQLNESANLTDTVNGMLSDLCRTFETDNAVFLHRGAVQVKGRSVECEIQVDFRTAEIAILPVDKITRAMEREMKSPVRQQELAIILIEQCQQLMQDALSTDTTNTHHA